MRFCLTTVLEIIIMKKLHRGVAQMVARMVRDHEAASSSLATPTISLRTLYRSQRFFIPTSLAQPEQIRYDKTTDFFVLEEKV